VSVLSKERKEKLMSEDDPKNQPELEALSDTELDEVAGGMQNQLNNNPTTKHPGGANSKINSNLGKVSILCDEIPNKG
jgi:hypothetical protein